MVTWHLWFQHEKNFEWGMYIQYSWRSLTFNHHVQFSTLIVGRLTEKKTRKTRKPSQFDSWLTPDTTEGCMIPSKTLRTKTSHNRTLYLAVPSANIRPSTAYFWHASCCLNQTNNLNLFKVVSILFHGQSPFACRVFFANLRTREKVSSYMIGTLSFWQQDGQYRN